MSVKTTIQTKCPVCEKKYEVPATAVGHRARCAKCQSVFRVSEPLQRHPTEDDIMRWLNEAGEEMEKTAHPVVAADLGPSAEAAKTSINMKTRLPTPLGDVSAPDVRLRTHKDMKLRRTG